MTAAKETRHWNPEAHIGDDRGANAPGRAAGRQRRGRGSGAPTRRGRSGANAPGRQRAPTRRPAHAPTRDRACW
eukprot:jgi/Tetstr1/445354/TSEL_033152.t1